MYSLVNIATLVRDLSRHPNGGAVATDLLVAFGLGVDALADIDGTCEPAPESQRSRVAAALRALPHALDVLAATRDVADDVGFAAWSASVDVLERAAIGGHDELVRFVTGDVLATAWDRAGDVRVALRPRALAVVTDGVTSSYAGPTGDDDARRLGTAWRRWVRRTDARPHPVDDVSMRDVVTAVATMTADDCARVSQALRTQRADGWSWPEAMHDACWAASLTGRERSTAVAQLHALRSVLNGRAIVDHGDDLDQGRRLDHGDDRPPPPSYVAAVVAAVAATAVADVLPSATVWAMTQPLFRSLS